MTDIQKTIEAVWKIESTRLMAGIARVTPRYRHCRGTSPGRFGYCPRGVARGRHSRKSLTQRGISFEPLDNGIRSSDEATRVQRIADTLDAAKQVSVGL